MANGEKAEDDANELFFHIVLLLQRNFGIISKMTIFLKYYQINKLPQVSYGVVYFVQ